MLELCVATGHKNKAKRPETAAGLVMGDISKLKQSLVLYEASVTAALLGQRYEEESFF